MRVYDFYSMTDHNSTIGTRITDHLLDSLAVGVVVFDADLRIIIANRAAVELLGTCAQLDDQLRILTVESRYNDWTGSLNDAIRQPDSTPFSQVVVQHPDKRQMLVDMLCTPLHDAAELTGNNQPAGILLMDDVTAKVSLEQRLAVSERLAAVGKLAAKVAHELNNPLDGIIRYLNLATRVMDSSPDLSDGSADKVRSYLDNAQRGLQRMVRICSELLDFSRASHIEADDTDINGIIDEAVTAMTARIDDSHISVVCHYDTNLPAVRAGNLFQVFCNLIKNALDAMEHDGGTLTITSAAGPTAMRIQFADTGPGLGDDVDKLFKPFYTTKDPGKGTGLGLAVCKEIIEKYNGRLLAENSPQGGAVFTIEIPLSSCRARSRLQVQDTTG